MNYYRYLVGSPEITETPVNCEDLQVASVVQALSLGSGNDLTHHLELVYSKPSDMEESFYNTGVYAKHHIVSSATYKTPVYPFFDESYFSSTSGHRTALLSPETYNVDWGLGNTVYGRISISKDNYNKMENVIAAYPSPGYFPKQDLLKESDWDIYLNANNFGELTDEEKQNVVVTIKSVEKNETTTYTLALGNLYIGDYIIHMLRPSTDDTYYNGDYEVYVTNLKDVNGELVDLKYTVKFFDKYEGIELNISSVTYGNGVSTIQMDIDFNDKILAKILPTEATLELETGNIVNTNLSAYTITNIENIYGYLNKYSCIATISEMPSYVKDENNILSNGITINVWQNESNYSYKYDAEEYKAKEGENLNISITNIKGNEEYSEFKWYKIENNTAVQLQNGDKYIMDGTNLTIVDLNENDITSYFVVNTEINPEMDMNIYVSRALKVSIKPDYLKGDINNDGKITTGDLSYGLARLTGTPITEDEIERGDVTGDGKYTTGDLSKLMRFLTGGINEL